jgi:hypothetical protein
LLDAADDGSRLAVGLIDVARFNRTDSERRRHSDARIAAGYDADLTIVDLKREETITNAQVASRAGWTPYDGKRVRGWPVGTVVRGRRVMWDGKIIGAAHGAHPSRSSKGFNC